MIPKLENNRKEIPGIGWAEKKRRYFQSAKCHILKGQKERNKGWNRIL